MACRFVVLFHIVPIASDRQEHWDLMLESPSFENGNPSEDSRVLKTWALDSEPRPGEKMKALQLPDHRAAFLTFEGPLTNGRGEVKRQFGGELEWITNEPDFKLVELLRSGTSWLLSLQRVQGEEFEVEITAKS
jgi:hypothetical protein